MADLVTLLVSGRRFEGWTSCDVVRGIDAATSAFSLTLTDRDPAKLDEVRQVKTGEACQVLVGGQLVISGFVDDVAPAFAAEDHTISITGRGRIADLVDCSAVHRPGSWKGRSLTQIAAELAKPFGIKVAAKADVGAVFARFALQPGEKVIDALGRAAAFRGVLLIETPAGDLEIVTPGGRKASFSLAQGVNLLAARATHSARDRFSRYLLKGQSAGDDHLNGAAASGPKGEAADPAVTRYRPLIVMAEDQATSGSLKTRAAWEATVRAGKGQTAEIDLQGWRDPTGAIWEPNLVVPIVAPWLNIEDDMLVTGVRFSLDDGGSVAVLSLTRPEAYSQLKIPASAEAGRVKRKRGGK